MYSPLALGVSSNASLYSSNTSPEVNAVDCVVYGMPQMAIKAGGVNIELPLLDIPGAMLKFCEKTQERL